MFANQELCFPASEPEADVCEPGPAGDAGTSFRRRGDDDTRGSAKAAARARVHSRKRESSRCRDCVSARAAVANHRRVVTPAAAATLHGGSRTEGKAMAAWRLGCAAAGPATDCTGGVGAGDEGKRDLVVIVDGSLSRESREAGWRVAGKAGERAPVREGGADPLRRHSQVLTQSRGHWGATPPPRDVELDGAEPQPTPRARGAVVPVNAPLRNAGAQFTRVPPQAWIGTDIAGWLAAHNALYVPWSTGRVEVAGIATNFRDAAGTRGRGRGGGGGARRPRQLKGQKNKKAIGGTQRRRAELRRRLERVVDAQDIGWMELEFWIRGGPKPRLLIRELGLHAVAPDSHAAGDALVQTIADAILHNLGRLSAAVATKDLSLYLAKPEDNKPALYRLRDAEEEGGGGVYEADDGDGSGGGALSDEGDVRGALKARSSEFSIRAGFGDDDSSEDAEGAEKDLAGAAPGSVPSYDLVEAALDGAFAEAQEHGKVVEVAREDQLVLVCVGILWTASPHERVPSATSDDANVCERCFFHPGGGGCARRRLNGHRARRRRSRLNAGSGHVETFRARKLTRDVIARGELAGLETVPKPYYSYRSWYW